MEKDTFTNLNDECYINYTDKKNKSVNSPTVCPRSSDPFYVVSYYKNGSLLPGHTLL